MRILLAVASLTAAVSQAAGIDVPSLVNSARQHGCNAPVTRAALQSNLKLQEAAGRLAGGAALHEALAAEGYLASESSALRFSDAMSDAQISRALTANYCRTLINPKLRDIGAQRRGRDLWIVLAAPVAAPGAADAAQVSRQILDRVNAARAAGRRCGPKYFSPVAPLTLNPRLTSAALAHSRAMAKTGDFDHREHDGSTPAMRVARAGYGASRIVGENIAAGAMTAAEVTEGWLASPPHCENIMDVRFTQMGIAYATNLNSAGGMYWTQEFSAPR
ncbi:MAG TPA: CAP domain-containing protein [Steroidobacteraceae bacterium]|nr:CAP domain-containing protein [Steroidobacteraceae bacterium]